MNERELSIAVSRLVDRTLTHDEFVAAVVAVCLLRNMTVSEVVELCGGVTSSFASTIRRASPTEGK
jgi:hypothetical protein